MFTSLASYLKYGNTFSGIEVTTIEAKTSYFGVTAQKKKGEFENITFCQGDSFSKIAETKESILHAFLVVNTDKVLIKEIGLEKDTPKALSTAFPGLSTDDFYFEIIHSFEKSYVAVCRKEEVELILKEAAKEKISIIGVSLGFSKIQGLLSILNGNEIVLTRQTLQIDQENIVSYSNESKINKVYLIDGIKVSSNYLLALASLFGYISQTSTFSNTATKNKFLEKGYSERNTFRKTLGVGLGFLLIVFLVNMFYYTSYRKQYQQLEEETQLASVQKETLLKKTKEVEKKEQVIYNILNTGNSKSSYFINRIVTSIPHSIVFSEITYQPLAKSIRPDKPIEYNIKHLLIKGESWDKDAFSRWIEHLEKQDWVANVTVSNYGVENPSIDNFELNLTLNNGAKK